MKVLYDQRAREISFLDGALDDGERGAGGAQGVRPKGDGEPRAII